jgi:hypothetical protein
VDNGSVVVARFMRNFNDTGYGRWKRGRGGEGVQPSAEGKRGRRQGGSTVLEVKITANSGAMIEEAEGSCWCLEVEDEQRKLGQWAECVVGMNC